MGAVPIELPRVLRDAGGIHQAEQESSQWHVVVHRKTHVFYQGTGVGRDKTEARMIDIAIWVVGIALVWVGIGMWRGK